MSAPHHSPAGSPAGSMAERYGAPPVWRKYFLLGVVVVVVGSLAVLWTWITLAQSDPTVSSELITSEIVDDHEATAVIRVKWGDDPVEAHCTVRAIAHDKTVVGEETFEPSQDGSGDSIDTTVTIRTERRATAVESVGCTAEGQLRPR
ncbi:DUF4307 domain-containing protein [Nocardioides humilatus]|uniref:DUF4307 domain-containing protein n=1 Tax=Nocardioides humilatus TaxID=2607660 RepID=A0A5B1LET2_9ACTN|nr:DUF4307 domain-containing protein [Nocardioides humilatus]KAA1418966.1 DUF4307 domain-containing protein [Nocardioides humilatus]